MNEELDHLAQISARLARIEQQLHALDVRMNGLEAWSKLRFGYKPIRERPEEPATVAPLASASPPFEVTPPRPSQPLFEAPTRPAPPPHEPEAARPAVESEPLIAGPAARWAKSWTAGELEQLLSGRGLAWAGGLALIVGTVFFVSLAFSRGWIGPTARVTIGALAGVALVAAGAWCFERRETLFGHVLTPVGLAIFSLSVLAATRLYDLMPIEAGLAATLASAVAVAFIAIRANAQLVAAYGLVSVFLAPPILGADPNLTTIAFLSTALVGSASIALYRTWSWLPSIAFLLTAPQLAVYIVDETSLGWGMTMLGGFWLLNAIAAGGEEFRIRRNRLSVTSTTLLVANAGVAIWGGFVLLQGDVEWARGLFLLVVALAHLALGGYFLFQEGEYHPFGMLAFGTGIASATMAVPIQFGGPAVPVIWTAEAAALAWVYGSRRHRYSGALSTALGAMAIGHLLAYEYPPTRLAEAAEHGLPFMNADGATLAFVLGGLAVAGALVPVRWVRGVLAAIGATLVVYALPQETSGLLLLACWSILFVLIVAAERRLVETGTHRSVWLYGDWPGAAQRALLIPAVLAGALAVFHALAIDLPLKHLGTLALPDMPFFDSRTAAALILIAAALLAGYAAESRWMLRMSILASFAIAAYLLPFEVAYAAVVVAWSILAVALIPMLLWDRQGARAYLTSAGGLLALGALLTMSEVAPLTRLTVNASTSIDHPLYWSGATAAIGSIAVALLIFQRAFRSRGEARWVGALAAVAGVYLLSVGLVDEFQRRVGGPTALEELQKQAQVGLSILWAVLGVGAFVFGVIRWRATAREVGLALLALATGKVFIYDLASLDAAYRVLSFIGLGILLLVSAYVYQRVRPQLSERPEA